MKIPHTVDYNTVETYKKVPKCDETCGICSSNFQWDKSSPERLSEICVRKLAENWGSCPISEFSLAKDRNFLLEVLDTKLPLNLLAEHIPDDVFWKRAYREKWPHRFHAGKRPYIQLYMEAHCTEELEVLHPKAYDPEKISDLVNLWSPHVKKLTIRSMIPADVPGNTSQIESIIDKKENMGKTAKQYLKSKIKALSRDHIPLSAILSGLPLLSEIHLTFGQRAVGAAFRRDLFQMTHSDVKHLVLGIENCPQLKILRITSSDLDCIKLKSILKALADNLSLKVMDFSHCKIGDVGALYLSKFIIKHPAFKEMILVNNKIGVKGAEGFAYAISHPASRLLTLNLRMNSNIGSEGAAYIATALLRGTVVQILNLSACAINRDPVEGAPDCGQLIASAISAGKTPLRELDLSVNDLGPAAGAALAAAMDSPASGGAGGPAKMSVRAANCGRWEALVARAALRNAGRRRTAALRFRRGAARLLAATRVARAIGIVEADPIDLAKHLTSRPSYVSVMSIESEALTQLSLPEIGDFEPFNFNLPPLKNPLPESPESSIATTAVTSRRSSFHGSTAQTPIEEVRKSALVRRGSADGGLVPGSKSAESHRRIKISIVKTLLSSKNKMMRSKT